jgi:hypothetical protein
MSNVVLLKRSAVAGKVPTTSQMALGELAVNTTDGKVFLKKNVSGTESVVDLTNFAPPTTGTGILAGNGSGGFSQVSTGDNLSFVNGTLSASGSVNSVSVASANGFAGTVATASTTPAITISISVSGLLKGSNGGLSEAVAGTDYLAPSAIGVTIDPAGTATAMAIALG